MAQHRHRVQGLVVVVTALLLVLGQMSVAGAQEAPPESPGAGACAGRGIPESKIGIQLFTYLPALGDGIDTVIEHMSDVGMRNIERFGGTFGLTLEEYDQLYRDNHVRPVSSHGSLDPDTWDQTLADAKALRQIYVGSGGFGEPGFGSIEDTLQTAENLNELGRRAKQQGLKLIVHNHDGEFTTTYLYDLDGDGDLEETPVVEIVLAETDRRYVSLELDVHWARVGLAGGRGSADLAENVNDPANHAMLIDFIERWDDRIALMHVKDTAYDGSITEVGQGTTDWAAVFEAADHVKYYFVEYDFPPDPYFTAENGFEYLSCLVY